MNRRTFLQLLAAAPVITLPRPPKYEEIPEVFDHELTYDVEFWPGQMNVFSFEIFGQTRINLFTKLHYFYPYGIRTLQEPEEIIIKEVVREYHGTRLNQFCAPVDACIFNTDDTFCPIDLGMISPSDPLSFLVDPIAAERFFLMLVGQVAPEPPRALTAGVF